MALCRALAALHLMMVFTLHSAHADQIVLKNGDRLTGKVISKTDDTLKYRTEYAGEIKVRWQDVVSITTDEPVTVMSADGKLEKVRLERAGAGGAKLVSEEESHDVPLGDLAHINPPRHVAGTGVTYGGRVSLLANASRGNTDDGRLYLEGLMTARAKAYSYGINFQAENKEESGISTAQNFWLAGRYNRVIDDARFAYVRGAAQHDKFIDIRLRTTLGAGLGWKIWDADKKQLSLLGGLDYVGVERTVGASKSFPALGWGVDYRQWVWDDNLELYFNQWGFSSLKKATGDTSFRTRTGVRIPLGSKLSANAQLNYDYESDPGPSRKKTDVQVLMGLTYDF